MNITLYKKINTPLIYFFKLFLINFRNQIPLWVYRSPSHQCISSSLPPYLEFLRRSGWHRLYLSCLWSNVSCGMICFSREAAWPGSAWATPGMSLWCTRLREWIVQSRFGFWDSAQGKKEEKNTTFGWGITKCFQAPQT